MTATALAYRMNLDDWFWWSNTTSEQLKYSKTDRIRFPIQNVESALVKISDSSFYKDVVNSDRN